MKKFFTLAPVLLSVLLSVALTVLTAESSFAAKKKQPVKNDGKPKLETSMKFSGSSLHGKYQSSFGSAATVENDKFLEDLLAGRKRFEDRNQKETERN